MTVFRRTKASAAPPRVSIAFGNGVVVVDESRHAVPDPFERAYGEGCELFNAGQFEGAIAAFARAADLRPDDFRPWEMTGCCFGGLSRWEECIAAFERSRSLGHECEHCWYNRSMALCELRRAEEALRAVDRSLELGPDNPEAWHFRGLILGMAHGRAPGELEKFDGRHEQAVAAFDRVLALQPDHYAALYCKAYTLYKISHSCEATQNLIAAGSPPNVLEQAVECVERAIALSPDDAQAVRLREQILAWMRGED